MKHWINPLRHQIDIQFDEVLHIKIETERCIIQSVSIKDKPNLTKLLGDPIVMKKFNTGLPWDQTRINDRLDVYLRRWQDLDPFSVYSIFDKASSEFIGVIGLMHDAPGQSEIFYATHYHFWGKGYGTEVVDAMVRTLVPRLMLRGFTLEGVQLSKMIATARLDNPASQKLLLHVGFKEEKTVYMHEAKRHYYSLPAKQLRNNYHHFYNRKDRELAEMQYNQVINEDVDISAENMACSDFGKGLNFVKKNV